MKNILLIVVIIGIIVLTGWLYFLPSEEEITSFEECVEAGYLVIDSYPEQCKTPDGKRFVREINGIADHIASKSDLIVVSDVRLFSGDTFSLVVTGEARGYWYFEGDFPIILEDENGNLIAESFATAKLDLNDPESTWMTEDFVPFEGTLEFSAPNGEIGILVLKRDNPTGLPEHDDELRIPVNFFL